MRRVCVHGEARAMQSVDVAAHGGSLVVVYSVLGSAVCPEKDMFEFVLLLSCCPVSSLTADI